MQTSNPLIQQLEIISNYSNWQDKYKYLINIGSKLPPYDDKLLHSNNLINHCSSETWLKVTINNDNIINISAYSRAKIINSMLYLIYLGLNNQNLSTINDISKLFKQYGIYQIISDNRRLGLGSIFAKINDEIKNNF